MLKSPVLMPQAPSTIMSTTTGVRPAQAMLASSMIGDEVVRGIVGEQVKGVERKREERTGTGLASLDEVLEGGFRSGREGLVCVSGEKGVGRSELALSLLTTHLLTYPTSTAALIDTTGTFDVITLYNLILTRLRNPSLQQAYQSSDDLEATAAKTLDRVKIMRVFDFEGLIEAIGEVREELEEVAREKEREKTSSSLRLPRGKPLAEPPKPKIREEVADSEDEDDDEMLFESSALPEPDESAEEVSTAQKDTEDHRKEIGENPSTGFILIDNITQLLTPLLKTNYIPSTALLTSFLRTLSNLTHTHNLITLIINNAHTPRPTPTTTTTNSNPQSLNAPPPPQPPHYTPPQPPAPSPSIFTSNTLVPAIGPPLLNAMDVNLLVSKLPKGREDARRFYAQSGKTGKKIGMVSVVEVIGDRWEGRVGRWGVFGVGEGGGIGGI